MKRARAHSSNAGERFLVKVARKQPTSNGEHLAGDTTIVFAETFDPRVPVSPEEAEEYAKKFGANVIIP